MIEPATLLEKKTAALLYRAGAESGQEGDVTLPFAEHCFQDFKTVEMLIAAKVCDLLPPKTGIFVALGILRVSGADDVIHFTGGVGAVTAFHLGQSIGSAFSSVKGAAASLILEPASAGAGSVGRELFHPGDLQVPSFLIKALGLNSCWALGKTWRASSRLTKGPTRRRFIPSGPGVER